MGNSGPVLYPDHAHPISTPTSGKKTDNFPGGLAPIVSQAATYGDGPKFRVVIDKSEEMSTGHDLPR
jgi:hypothetical protein